MPAALGIDTSNYTTSAAVAEHGRVIANCKKLLPVKEGTLGLRQSDAVFAHVRQLDGVVRQAMQGYAGRIAAIGVSDRPRMQAGSYMPCFQVGLGTAHTLGAVLRVPVYTYSHQQGHIAAALYSSGRMDLLGQPFLAFHVSGGTTEVLLVGPALACEVVCASLDLKIGQAVDRVGRMLGLPFPAGAQLDALAQNGVWDKTVKVTLIGDNCSVSGLENQCRALYQAGEKPENVAAYLFMYIAVLIERLYENVIARYGDLPVIFSGGVMCNSIVRRRLAGRHNVFFCAPEFSSDNAAGLAYLALRENDESFDCYRITT